MWWRGVLCVFALLAALVLGGNSGVAQAAPATSTALAGTFNFSPLDFGDVIVGQTVTRTLIFTNTGDSRVNFNRSTGPNPDAGDTTGLNATDTVLCRNQYFYPTESCTMQMSFTALAVGPVTGTLTLYDEYTTGFQISVQLRGNGVSATPAPALTVAAARGPYRGNVDLQVTLSGCVGAVADRALTLTIATPAGSRTVSAITAGTGIATVAGVSLAVPEGATAQPIPAGSYAPSAGWGISAAFAGGDGCAAASGTATLTVDPRTPALTFVAPIARTYGEAPFALDLGSSAADDPAAPTLVLTYEPATICSGPSTPPATVTIHRAGDCAITVSQPAGTNLNYVDAAPITRTVTIGRATPLLDWAAPSAIVYGTPLGSGQLNATARFGGTVLAGSFAYTPGMGSLLGAGQHTLGVTFTPTDSSNFITAQTSVVLTVERATPTVSWIAPAAIVYGTPLGVAQLRASATVAGQFTYSPNAGVVLNAGTHTLTALFIPTDTANYTTASGVATLLVEQAPLLVIAQPASRRYGASDPPFTVVYDRFVNGEGVSVLTGTLSCVTDAAHDSPVGSGYLINCSGLAATNYVLDYRPAALTIERASSVLSMADTTAIYGRASVGLAATIMAPGPLVPANFTFQIKQGGVVRAEGAATTLTSGVVGSALSLDGLAAGEYALAVRFAGNANVAAGEAGAQLWIDKATQAITFAPPTEHPFAAGALALIASANSALAVSFTVAADAPCSLNGAVMIPLRAGSCVITAIQAGNGNYYAAPGVTRTVQILPAVASPTPALTYALTLTTSAGGTVTAAAPGPRYPAGTRVTLRVLPESGFLFAGWTIDGVAQGWSPNLVVVMRGERQVTATFTPQVAFSDLASTGNAATPIAQLAASGIIKGYGDGSYGPDDPVLRAQMAALIVRALGWDGATGGPLPFADRGGVDAELWRAIEQLATRGITRGYGDGTYRPHDPVLHIQAISFVTRALIAAGVWQRQPDDPRLIPNVALVTGHREDFATYLHYAGALPGLTPTARWEGPTGWDQPATRAWFAQILWQALESVWGVEREV